MVEARKSFDKNPMTHYTRLKILQRGDWFKSLPSPATLFWEWSGAERGSGHGYSPHILSYMLLDM